MLARIVLETLTPLSIGAGKQGDLVEAPIMRDANDLPALPGTSIRGVLKHLYSRHYGAAEARSLFGDMPVGEDEFSSALDVSWGAMHDRKNKPIEGLLLGQELEELGRDPLVVWAWEEAPIRRDHVRIDHRGVDADGLKFERAAVPVGYRFSFEIGLWSDAVDDCRFERLLGLLALPSFRLGSGTRRGYGAVETRRARVLRFDLRKREDRERYAEMPAALGATPSELGGADGFRDVDVAKHAPTAGFVCAELILRPKDFWRFGRGQQAHPVHAIADRDAGNIIIPVRERRVAWTGENASVEDARLLVAASGIKGAIRHRLAYEHYRAINVFADEMTSEQLESACDDNAAVRAFFGWAGSATDKGSPVDEHMDVPHAGRVLLDDDYVDDRPGKVMAHNVIDRTMGSVLDLYHEELAYRGEIRIRLAILEPDDPGISAGARDALRRTLAALVGGRLGIGGGGNSGHSFCTGDVVWSDGGKWIGGGCG